jgi:hypothetical protein
MGGSLPPLAAPPLLPHTARRWEALAAAAPLLLLHPMTQVWRCGRYLLCLRHTQATPRPPQATTMNALMSERSAHMNTASTFQLFSIITKCICSFSDSMVRNSNWLSSRKNFSRRRRTTSHWLTISMLNGRRRP